MSESPARRSTINFSEHFIGGTIFVAMLLIFWLSPVHQVSDSRYSMLLSQCLLYHRSFALDHYNLPRLEPFQREDYVMNGDIYQLEVVGSHLYYFFPPGSSILSAPYVAAANALGLNAAFPDGSYNHLGEMQIEAGLAAILMAALAASFFYTSRLLLPLSWSVVLAMGGALGTQVWSTASRGMWSHTWGILLLGIVLHMLLAQEAGGRKVNPVVLSTLLAWMYFVRPSNSIFIAAITVYLFLYYRHVLLPYVVTGALWLACFVLYSWQHFGSTLPSYYRANRLRLDSLLIALPGNLISPARGLLVYVPALLFILFLLWRYWPSRPFPRLVQLVLVVLVVDLVVISCFPHWWGGASFGPRFCTDLVPWLLLLAVLSVRAMLNWKERRREEAKHVGWNMQLGQLAAGAALLLLSIFINGRGATVIETWKWNEQPHDIILVQKKLWDWRQPQFLAGLVHPPLDRPFPLLERDARIDFTGPEVDQYLWYGWSGPEPNLRWTEAREAALVFALRETEDLTFRVRLTPFAPRGIQEEQRLSIALNGHRMQSFSLKEEQPYELTLTLPKSLLRRENSLTLELPDARSPESLRLSVDQRPLGVAVEWMEFQRQPQVKRDG